MATNAQINETQIKDGSISNTQLSSGAGISYVKLNLVNSILNGDISTGAAISYSKLNLSNGIVNNDIASGANIGYSKLNLLGSITDNDIATAASIDSAKIGGGNINNTEFGYLEGVTSNIQLQINALSGGGGVYTPHTVMISNALGIIISSTVTTTELGYVSGVTSPIQTQINAKEPTITAGTSSQYWRGDKTWQTLDTTAVTEGTNLYYTDVRADARITAQKGAINGLATLDASGLIPSSQLPAIAITNTYVVGSQVAMLALTAQTGDLAIRTDENKSYVLAGTDPTVLGDWQVMLTPTDAVLSVNGYTGSVSLTTSDITEGTNLYYTNARGIASVLTGYTSGAGTVASTDSILQAIQKLNGNDALKANIASPTFTGTVTLDTLQAGSTAGIAVKSSSGTDVALLGTSNSSNALFYGNLTVNGTVTSGSAGGNIGRFEMYGSTSGVVGVDVLATAGTWTLTLPNSGGSNNYVLQTDGAGNTIWSAVALSVNGYTGTVSLTTSDITEGTNLYYTNTRADARITLQKGAANGLAPLDAASKIDASYLPAIAITNTYVVASQVAMLALTVQTGDVAVRTDLNKSYILAGTDPTVLADWQELLTPTDAVSSVNGLTGVVTLSTTNIAEGTNLYYTAARFNTAFSGKSTTDLAEGTNLYYTTARFDTQLATKTTTNLTEGTNLYYTTARFDTALATKSTTNLSEGTNLYYTAARFNTAFSGKSTTDLSEGTNLYYTNARGIGSTLTGYTSGAGTISSADTILQAIQKLNANDATNANLTGVVTSVGNTTSIANGAITNAMLANGAVANLSGTNTGDQTNITGNAATVTTNANLTGPITSVGNTTSVASQTGTGSTFAMSVSPAFTGVVTNTGTSSITLGDVTGALRTGSVMITSPYLADGFSPALYFSSTDDNASVPKAAIFCKTTGGGSFLYMGTSNSYVSGVTTSIAIDPNGGIYVGDISALNASFNGRVALTGNPSFVSASSNAYVYHSTALGLVMYGSGTSDDFTLAGPSGANILSVATGTTTARFYGAVNIGGTFTRRTQSGVLSQLQVEGTDFDTSSLSLFANNTGATVCPALFLSRSRGATVGSNTIVQSGDRLGIMLFEGTDGVKPVPGVILQAVVDGTPGVDDMPTRFEVMTCPDGSSSPTVKTVTGSNGSFTVGATEGTGTGSLYIGSGGNIDWGTYTPTRSAESNLDSNVTILSAQYMRVGNTVTVSGLFVADPTSTATITSFEMSLPIASNLGANEDLTGVAKMVSVANEGMAIFGNITNNTAIVYWISGNTASQTSTFTYTYRII